MHTAPLPQGFNMQGYLFNGSIVGVRVVLDRDLGSHASHCMYTPLVAGANEQQTIRLQEAYRHAHSAPAVHTTTCCIIVTHRHCKPKVPS